MFRQHNPLDAPAAFGAFSNGIEVPAGMRLLFVKGQIGAGRDGNLPDDFESQARNAWGNVLAVLRSAGMDARNLVQVRTHLARRSDFQAFRAIRDEFVHRHVWRKGDVVIWDNRSTMHCATPYDDRKYRRVMHRTTIKGTRPF